MNPKTQLVRWLGTLLAFLPCGIIVAFLSTHNVPVLIMSLALDIIAFVLLAVLQSTIQRREQAREVEQQTTREAVQPKAADHLT